MLLRERKRHTAGRVASTPSVVQSGGGGSSQDGGTPSPQGKDMGPVKYYGMEMGYPPPPRVWTNKQTETFTFRHPSDAGGKNCDARIKELDLNKDDSEIWRYQYGMVLQERANIFPCFAKKRVHHYVC